MNNPAQVPLHLHKALEIGPHTQCEVHLDQAAQVYLMDGENYAHYGENEEFVAFGGSFPSSPARLRPDKPGLWHLVIEQDGKSSGVLNVQVSLITVGSEKVKNPKAKKKTPGSKPMEIPPISLEVGTEGRTYVIKIGNNRKIFSRQEMQVLLHQVKRGTNLVAKQKLVFNHLYKERRDFLMENDIDSLDSPIMTGLIQFLQTQFPAVQD